MSDDAWPTEVESPEQLSGVINQFVALGVGYIDEAEKLQKAIRDSASQTGPAADAMRKKLACRADAYLVTAQACKAFVVETQKYQRLVVRAMTDYASEARRRALASRIPHVPTVNAATANMVKIVRLIRKSRAIWLGVVKDAKTIGARIEEALERCESGRPPARRTTRRRPGRVSELGDSPTGPTPGQPVVVGGTSDRVPAMARS